MGPKRVTSRCALALLLVSLCTPVLQAAEGDIDVLGPYAAVFFGCVGAAFLISLCLSLALSYFMYRDAQARGEKAILWGFVGFFGGLLGLLVWLIIRPEKKKGVENATPS
jgi:hypothetical protein